MDQNLATLVAQRKVTMETALERCSNEEDLRRLVQSAGNASAGWAA